METVHYHKLVVKLQQELDLECFAWVRVEDTVI